MFLTQITSKNLSNSSSFPFRFQKSKDITLSNWTFDISGDGSLVVDKFDSDLGTLTLGAGSSDDGDDFGVSRLVGFIHFLFVFFKRLALIFLK